MNGPWLLLSVVTGVLGFLILGEWAVRVWRWHRYRLRLKRLRELKTMMGPVKVSKDGIGAAWDPDKQPQLSAENALFLRSCIAHKVMNGTHD